MSQILQYTIGPCIQEPYLFVFLMVEVANKPYCHKLQHDKFLKIRCHPLLKIFVEKRNFHQFMVHELVVQYERWVKSCNIPLAHASKNRRLFFVFLMIKVANKPYCHKLQHHKFLKKRFHPLLKIFVEKRNFHQFMVHELVVQLC